MNRHAVFLVLLLATSASLAAQDQFRSGRLYRSPGLGPGDLYNSTTGDVNGDGHVDIILSRDYAGVSLLMNDGRGSFSNETGARLPTPISYATYQVDAADMDGDGDLDLVVANDHSNANKLLLNNGQGYFSDQSARFPTNGNWTTAQAVLDVEGDGDLDVFFYNYGEPCHLFLNDGKGNFTDGSAGLPSITFGYRPGVVAGDLDGDGDSDILLAYGTTQVLENVGGARFVVSTAIVLPATANSYRAHLADFDGDARLDIFFTSRARLLLGQGGGKFTDVTTTHLPGSGMIGVLADVDLDGDLDFVSARLLWLNDGKGHFSDASTRMTLDFRTDLTVAADLDADGDPDLYSPLNNAVYMNFHRQLDAVAPPQVGATYNLDFHVRPGYATGASVAVPFFSIQLGQLPVPPYGIFGLALSPLLVLPPIQVPAAGSLTLPIPIPPDSSLRYLLLGHQAFVLDAPIGLGNVVADPIL